MKLFLLKSVSVLRVINANVCNSSETTTIIQKSQSFNAIKVYLLLIPFCVVCL